VTWVRYDDNVRNHPKVESLDDATYRLWREAIEWCAQNLTDGVILTRQLGLTSTRANAARARKLVDRGLWHKAGETCDSKQCPPCGPDGWVIHDYFDYQPTAEAAREEQAKARERKRRWLEARRNAGKNGVPDAVPDGVLDAGKNGNPAPSRPAPLRAGGTASHQAPPAAAGDGGAAGVEVSKPGSSRPCPRCGNPMKSAFHRNVCVKTELGGVA